MDISLLGFGAIQELFNVHPMFVHFPAALLPAAFLLYGLGIGLKKSQLNSAARTCLYLGTAGALAALVTGLRAEGSIPHNETIHRMMETHAVLAWITLGFSAVLSGWSFLQTEHRPKAAWAFLALLGLANLAMMQGADIGARMVYLEGAAVKPAAKVISDDGTSAPAPEPAAAPPAGHEGHHHHH